MTGQEKGSRHHDDTMARIYLISYNSIALLLWTIILLSFVGTMIKFGTLNKKSISSWYDSNGIILQVTQMSALLELLHIQLRLVNSNLIVSAIQIFSRIHIVMGIFRWTREAQSTKGLAGCVVAWSIAEMIRYSYYIVGLLKIKAPLLQGLRYSGFLVLYPLGIGSEVVSIIRGLPAMYKLNHLRHWPVPMPNTFNFELDLVVVYIVILVLYVPGSVHMYNHMLRQRRKYQRKLLDAAEQKKVEAEKKAD